MSRTACPTTTTAAASRNGARAGSGDEQAMLHLVGRAMGGGGVYAQERKGRKKGSGGRGRPSADVVCAEYARVA